MPFNPAVREQRFVLDHVANLPDLAATGRFADATPDLVDAVLEGAGAFAAGEWAPLAREGDTAGPKWTPEGVKMPAGYPEAYKAYVEGGWGTIGAPGDFGGQGLPFVLSIQDRRSARGLLVGLQPRRRGRFRWPASGGGYPGHRLVALHSFRFSMFGWGRQRAGNRL